MSNPADPFFTRQWHKPYIKLLLLSGALVTLLMPPAYRMQLSGAAQASTAKPAR